MSSMKTGVFTAPLQISMEDRPVPEAIGDQVLIKLKYTGICGTDLKIYDGSIPYVKQGLLTYPIIPGHEWSGEVVSVGPEVTGIIPGERVTGECHIGCGKCDYCLNGRTNVCPKRIRIGILGHDGAFAEYITLPEKAVHRLPDAVTDQEGALVEPLTIALHALDKLDSVAGSCMLVFGLGPIGLLTCQAARAMGAATVIGVDIDKNRLTLAEGMGLDHVTSASGDDLFKELQEMTNGHGIDIIVEATGAKPLLKASIELIRPGGQVSLVGLYNGDVEINATQLITKDIKIYGNMAK